MKQKEESYIAYNQITKENEELKVDIENKDSEYNALLKQKEKADITYNELTKENEELKVIIENKDSEYNKLVDQNGKLNNKYNRTIQQKEGLAFAYDKLLQQKEMLTTEKEELIKSYKDLEEIYQNKLSELERKYNKIIVEKDKVEKKLHPNDSTKGASTKKIKDSNTLLISKKDEKVYLPYNVQEIENYKKDNKIDLTIGEIIEEKYTIPINYYKNKQKARYAEAYDLMRNKCRESIANSIKIAYEISQNDKIHPAIITACQNKDELDTYIQCLQNNSKFKIFDIQYE